MEIDAHGYKLECCAKNLGRQIYFIASICWESVHCEMLKNPSIFYNVLNFILIVDLSMDKDLQLLG